MGLEALSMTRPSAGYISQISIFLRPTMSVRPGEILEFHAPGFTGPEQITVSVVFKVMTSTGWALSSCIRQGSPPSQRKGLS